MLTSKALLDFDWRMVIVIACIMGMSLFVLGSFPHEGDGLLSPLVRNQLRGFGLGWLVYFLMARLNYQRLREWTWILYLFMIISLIGVFFTDSIQRVHRWYKIPLIQMNFQPSESAKLILVIALSWYLERRQTESHRLSTLCGALLIAAIPFLLILKQPDLGTALVLAPITCVMFYFGNLHPFVVRFGAFLGLLGLGLVAVLFLNIVPHENAKPYVTRVIKDYQYERLNPNTHHQQASATAIAVGGLTGTGWGKGDYTKHGWLPAPTTDSIFATFGEEFGLLGLGALMALYYALIYFCFQVVAIAPDLFGRLLSAGIAVYLAMHILVNVGMMCGVLPITGVPLVLMSYGGSSIIFTMTALGLLQSIYRRRFIFS